VVPDARAPQCPASPVRQRLKPHDEALHVTDADRRQLPIGTEVVDRALQMLLQAGEPLLADPARLRLEDQVGRGERLQRGFLLDAEKMPVPLLIVELRETIRGKLLRDYGVRRRHRIAWRHQRLATSAEGAQIDVVAGLPAPLAGVE
jgi:hypothetical protein